MFYLFLAIYSIIILIIGFLIRKGSKDFKEYFLAGRSLSWKSFSLTMSATWFGATSIIVLIDESFLRGFGSIWVMIVPTLLTLFLFIIFSDKIRKSNFISIPEILKNSYGDLFHLVSSITIFFYLLLLSSSQAIALGKVIKNFINLDFEFALLLGVTFVFLYSFRGGLLSVIRTDFFQLFMVFLGLTLIILFVIFVHSKNPLNNETIPLNFFNPFKDLGRNLLITLSFTIAWFISPVVWQRIVASKSDRDAKIGLLLTSFLLLLLFSLPTLIGIIERFVLREKPSFELINFILKTQLNQTARVIAFLAIVSAVISTLDSILNVSAMTLSSDIWRGIFKEKILNPRISLAISTFLTILISLPLREILLVLGLSSQFLACGLFIPLIFSMILKEPLKISGLLSLFSGFIYSLLSYFKSAWGLNLSLPQWPKSVLLGILISFFFFLIGKFLGGFKKAKEEL